MKTNHIPQQNSGTATVYNYNPDDSISSATDARGAMTSYLYNSLGLNTETSWSVPSGSGIQVPTDVEFEYDNLGNRTEMTDGLGSVVYEYDSLSQMTSETRQFTDALANAPLSNNRFKLEYSYTLSGGLKSLKDPYGQQFNYGHDKTGRLASVTGSTSFAGIANYASNAQYRAWNGLKHLEHGNGTAMNTTYNNRMLPSSFEYLTSSQAKIVAKNYSYLSDGSLKYAQDTMYARYDRLNRYDHLGRITEAKTGAEARGGTVATYPQQQLDLPYRQSYTYNAFDNINSRQNLNWGEAFGESSSWQNNRITGHGYDADGRNTGYVGSAETVSTTYDAAGRIAKVLKSFNTAGIDPYNDEITRSLSGDGLEGKRVQRDWIEPVPGQGFQWVARPAQYSIRSSVLGGAAVAEANSTGKKLRTFVPAGGTVIAWQVLNHPPTGGPTEFVYFEHADPSGASRKMTGQNGAIGWGSGDEASPAEFDPMGNNAGFTTPYPDRNTAPGGEGCIGCGGGGLAGFDDNKAIYVHGAVVRTSTFDGATVPLSMAISLTRSGGGTSQCPATGCSAVAVVNGRITRVQWSAHGDGYKGYISTGNKRKPPTLKGPVSREERAARKARSVAGIFDEPPEGDEPNLWGFPARRLFRVEAMALRKSVETALNNTNQCQQYISDLINKVAENRGASVVSSDMLFLFDVVFKSRGSQPGYGGIWGFLEPSNNHPQNYWDWVGGKGFASIGIAVSNFIPRGEQRRSLSAEGLALARQRSLTHVVTTPGRGGMAAIHELMHVAVQGGMIGGHAAGDDRDFANAAADLAGQKRLGDNSDFSGYWGERLNQACGFPSHLTHKPTDYKLYK